ncbi:MATE family efflux transporter [Saccharibacillus sp. CPCC 101409]|uniref:MATE family efflux transporter n=1 Tax=Saccharibacillus sp. CPCC 101409 TaxID=3058041 RepID=UPI00267196E3|nr:MATE family efflux transporter [Saccharibacillus sp. CPCC 101409]MDO3410101.1 MATE family efflux transporter [Saccharibacillus sp. CPCC 101409]
MVKQWAAANRSEMRIIRGMVLPLMFTQLIQIFFQFADQAIVGRLGVEEFAAIGVASSFIFLITGTLGMLCGAFNIIGGKCLGEGDTEGFGRAFNTSMSLSLVLGALFEGLILLGGRPLLKGVYGLGPDVLNPACEYLYMGGLTIGINMILFNFSAYFKNTGRARVLVYSLASASVVNVFMDYALVYGKFGFPEWGVAGAAAGSVIGYLTSIAISIALFRKRRLFRFSFGLPRQMSARLFRLYVPLALQDLVEYTLFAIALSAFVARLDVKLLAAYTITVTLLELFMIPMYGFSGACLTLSAQEHGRSGGGGRRYALLSCLMMLGCLLPLAVVMNAFSLPLAGWITDKEAIAGIVHDVLPVALVVGVFNGVQMVLRSTLQAVDLEKWVLWVSAGIYGLSLVAIYAAIDRFGLTGLYIGLGFCYALLGCSYAAKLRFTFKKTVVPG